MVIQTKIILIVSTETILNVSPINLFLGTFLVMGIVAIYWWGRRRWHLTQKLLPDQLVPNSQKIQATPSHLKNYSPWHNRVAQSSVTPEKPNKIINQLLSDLRLIFKYMRTYWSPYWGISVVSTLCLIAKPAYQLLAAQKLGVAIDQGGAALVDTAILLASLLPIAFGLSLLGERLSARLSSRIANDIRYDLFTHLQALSQEFHKKTRLGELLAHFSVDTIKVEFALGQEVVMSISDGIMILVNLGFMIRMSASLTAISLLPMLLMLPAIAYLMVRMSRQNLKANNQNASMMDAVQEGIRSQPFILGYGLQSLFAGYFGDELQRLEDKQTEGKFSIRLFQQAALFSAYLLSAWIMGVGGIYVLSGSITVGTWVALFTIFHNMYDGLIFLLSIRIVRWVESSVGMRRIDTVLEKPALIVDAEDAYPLPLFQNKISLEHLSFGYATTSNASTGEVVPKQLDEINLEIDAGQFVAFVGASGAGKSTIFNLLMRFYDASEGRIAIDGHDLRNITQKSLRSQTGVVLQETFLFNTSIMDNIRIARPEATEQEVIKATQSAELHEFVSSLPQGYRTVIGEGGGRLSGGQRQRIAIARALLKSPTILFLDEATSGLSADIADAITQTITNLAGKHTIIMITHQLKESVDADRIFVLDAGRLVEQGTHEELITHSHYYRHLWDIQNTTAIANL